MADQVMECVRFALEVASERGFSEVEIECDGVEFSARLAPRVIAAVSPAAAALPTEADSVPAGPELALIAAPCVGYLQPGKTPLEPGRRVAVGEIVGSISALGISNDVESTVAGEIVEVLATNGDAMEYGQPLARVMVEA